jgi:hypothetical protein
VRVHRTTRGAVHRVAPTTLSGPQEAQHTMLRFRRLVLNDHKATHIRLVTTRSMRTRSEFVFRKRFPRHHDTRSNSAESLTRSSPHIPALYRCWAGGVFLSQRLQQHPGPSVVPEPPSNLALLHKEHGSTRTPSNLALLHKAQALPPFNVFTALRCYVH